MEINLYLAGGLAILGLFLGYFLRHWLGFRSQYFYEVKAKKQLETAKSQAEKIILGAEEKATSVLAKVQQEERGRKHELRRLEERLLHKEDWLDRKQNELESIKENQRKEWDKIKRSQEEITTLKEQGSQQLEKIAHLTKEEAKKELLEVLEKESREELTEALLKLEKEKQTQLEAKALEIITSVIQRYARDHVADVTTSVVSLPNEEIKGKIIGREGKNIRAFEYLTGVEVIIDETPESLVLSSFDPLRREIARIALEKLIKDGRIQPVKIEEKVEEAKAELDEQIKKIGEEAAYEVGILDLPKEIIFLLGRLNYRTSYGQNVLTHSVEMAHLAGMMAAELKLNVEVAKKAALLHDIGKAIDHEVGGSHVELGRKMLKKYGLQEEIIKAMEAHHEEYHFSSLESYLVATADAISAARPGARRDTLEKYLHRLEEIEKIVNSFEGVRQSYAVSAGREVRVFVVPEKIDDFGALRLAREIAAKIQTDVNYPGEIKVTVIRETRAVEYAK